MKYEYRLLTIATSLILPYVVLASFFLRIAILNNPSKTLDYYIYLGFSAFFFTGFFFIPPMIWLLILASKQFRKKRGLYIRYKKKIREISLNTWKVSGKEIKLFTLDLSYRRITDITEITGLENLINLQVLKLNGNNIAEISGLENLSNLQILDLERNKITEISGLENLINLQELYLRSNKIEEISGLENLSNLQELYLRSNKIEEISGLENLSNLQILDLHYNKIEEISGLENLSNLQILGLHNNKIEEISGLENLSNLQEIDLDYNNITEIKGFSGLNSLIWLGLYGNPVYKWARKRFKTKSSYGHSYFSIKNVPELVKYCWKNEKATEEAIQYIKDLPLIYEEISFGDIQSKTEIEIAELRKIVEKLILEGQLEARIIEDRLYFAKSQISKGVLSKSKKTGFKPLEKGVNRDSTTDDRAYAKNTELQTVFLSYSTLDSYHFQISNIAKLLKSYPEIEEAFFWEADSRENIVEYMERTLKKCSVFVLFCSENAQNSNAVTDEWQAAFQLRKKGLLKIVPIFEDEGYIPALLTPLLNVEFSNDNFVDFILKLYKEITRK